MHTAFLLAAGLGTRLRPLTLERPKALLPVCGVPMLDYALALARAHGHASILVNAHYLWRQVAAWAVGGIHLEGWESTLIVALILGLLNATIRPLLFWLSLPLTCLTFGFFVLVLNTAMLGLTAWIAGKFDRIHFAIDGFWDAFWGAIIISLVAWALGWLARPAGRSRQ
ncbi:hypothetical protein EDM76_11015 [bacterium]|nr:MAG: hypothetical protein EDM76_11015 [bacterium]